jgi:hypothetical protein
MSDIWFAPAQRIDVGLGCGGMAGGPPRVVHHTTEGGSIAGAVATYKQTGDYPTFTANYLTDTVVQHLPVTTGATALMHKGGPETNRMGVVCIQIEWVGSAKTPFTAHATAGPVVRAFFDFLRGWGVPDVWPNGSPMPYPASYGANGQRDAATWVGKAGHYGHSQVPGNDHGDPGQLDPAFIKQSAQQEDIMASIDDLRAVIQQELAKAVDVLHKENVLILHGDDHHPVSLDSIMKAVQK